MSFREIYKVEGNLTIDEDIIKPLYESRGVNTVKFIEMLKEINSENVSIEELNSMLEKEKNKKSVIEYNGIKITANQKPFSNIYLDLDSDKLYIPGFDGSNLEFKYDKNSKKFILTEGYITDNMNNNLENFFKVAEAFKWSCKLIYVMNEELEYNENFEDYENVLGSVIEIDKGKVKYSNEKVDISPYI